MKGTRSKQTPPTNTGTDQPPAGAAPPTVAKRMTLSETLHKEFENFAASTFPEEFGNEADRKVLQATWFAATRQTVALIANNTLKPFHETAEKESSALLAALKGE